LHRPQLLAGAPPLPEPRRRTVCRLRRIPAASTSLDGFAIPCTASRCFPRIESSPGTLDRVSPASPPPLVAGRRRRPAHPAARRLPATRAVGSRSDASRCPRRSQAAAAARSGSNGPRSGQPESSQVKPSRPGSFAENTPSFPVFTKIPFHLRSFLTVQSFFFILAQNLFKSLQFSPYTFPKP
jgi:hypothetical protein